MVVGVPRSGSSIEVSVTTMAFCGVTLGGGTFGCAGIPCGLVACAGEAMVGSCT